MSGVEAAGFVLAAIPLVVKGLECYVHGVGTIKRYFKYKHELKSLLRTLKTEYDIFRNTCEELLEGLVQAQKMAILLQECGGNQWKDPAIEKKLKNRLQGAYSGYLETLDDMQLAVEEFKKRLRLKDGEVKFDETSTFKQEYKRLKFSLSKSAYEDLMVRIKQNNQTLCKLTEQSVRLEASRTGRYRHMPDFRGVRDFAKSVYATLCSSWRCNCQSWHTANLRLEARIGDTESEAENDGLAMKQLRFRIVFSFDHSSGSLSASTPWSCEEAEIRLLKENKSQNISNKLSRTTAPKQKSVRFRDEVEIPNTLERYPDLEPIDNLCRAIQRLQVAQRAQCLGFLMDEIASQKHGIFPPKEPSIDKERWSTVSLQELISPRQTFQRRFSQADRLHLAVILASSVLQLHETPWMDKTLQKEDIMFVYTREGPLYGQPFVARGFPANRRPDGQLQIAGPSGINRAIRNPLLFALGVLLIELCLGRPLEELKLPEEKASSDDGSSLWPTTLDWIAADRLVEDVYQKWGSRYGDAVRRCIRCDFDRRGASLEDEDFQSAVYDGVVSLLEDDLKQFHKL
ncbi:MAG: hypothetical protein Q9227_000602 [Pyrenula ochraceoflavens]